MPTLADYPITQKWPAKTPDIIQLYSAPTPNGVKIAIALEELGIPYEAHRVSFDKSDQHSPEFLSLNPNNKIPAIIDPNGPGGQPLPLWESGAILIYLAEKSGQLLPDDPHQRYQAIQWLMFQIGGIGPMIGQVGYFHQFAGSDVEDPRPLQHYTDEVVRLLRVLENQLEGQDWLVGTYSIADISVAPWLRNLIGRYDAADLVGWNTFKNIPAYLDRFLIRPAVQRGLSIPPEA